MGAAAPVQREAAPVGAQVHARPGRHPHQRQPQQLGQVLPPQQLRRTSRRSQASSLPARRFAATSTAWAGHNQRTLFISPRALTMVSPPPVQMTMSAPIAERPAAGLHSAHHSKPSNPHAHAWVSSKTPSGVLHLQQTSNDRASSPSLFFTAMAPSSSTA